MPQSSEADSETRLPSADPEGSRERREFRQTAIFVVAAHALVLLVFVLAAKFQPKPQIEQIQWLDGGLLGGGDDSAPAVPEPEPPLPPPDPVPEPPKAASEPSTELAAPKATPPPTTPEPATPKPATPKPATPKPSTPTPKPKPKATPKSTPKKSASPKPSSSPKASAKASPKPAAKTDGEGNKTKPGEQKTDGTKGPGVGEAKGKGTEGTGPGAGKPSDFGWYFGGLRDRYYAVWAPPSVPDAATLVVTLKIRVKRDGTVLSHELVKSSGNSLMDGSVLDAAQQVTKIDPLPPGFGGQQDPVEIPINFKPE